MKEKQRMQYYFSKYITYIEEKNYEKAYNLLYEEYRNNYFPTLEEFEKYVKQKYPDFMSVEYNDMSRQGEYYILTVNIYNLLTNEIIEKEQKYIIKENNFLDYVLSFQVRSGGRYLFYKFRTNFRIKIKEIFKKIWKNAGIVLILWIIMLIINYLLGNMKTEPIPITTYEPHISIMNEDKEVPKDLQEPINKIFNEYVNYCNNQE